MSILRNVVSKFPSSFRSGGRLCQEFRDPLGVIQVQVASSSSSSPDPFTERLQQKTEADLADLVSKTAESRQQPVKKPVDGDADEQVGVHFKQFPRAFM